jgi:hypothetical protein
MQFDDPRTEITFAADYLIYQFAKMKNFRRVFKAAPAQLLVDSKTPTHSLHVSEMY